MLFLVMAEEAVENFFNANESEIFGDYSSKVKFFSVTLNGVVTDFAVSDYVYVFVLNLRYL